MAESTLNIRLGKYLGQVGHFLGWGFGSETQNFGAYDDTPWSTFQESEVNFCVQSGISQFYFSNEWTFLKPSSVIPIPTGASLVKLPDDFAGFEGPITVTAVTNPAAIYRQVKVIMPVQIDQMYSINPTATGPMTFASQQPIKGTSAIGATREQLYFFPLADQDYTATVRYYLLADMLTGSAPYVYGGAQHAQTILQSCLAIAEFRKDNELGPQNAKYQELLATSKRADNRLKPQQFGKNRDTSDVIRGYRAPWWNVGPNTYNGQSMDPP